MKNARPVSLSLFKEISGFSGYLSQISFLGRVPLPIYGNQEFFRML